MTTSRLTALIDDYLAGSLSEPDREELIVELLARREARERFWQAASIHAVLSEWGKAHWGREAAAAGDGGVGGRMARLRGQAKGLMPGGGWAAAVAVCFGLLALAAAGIGELNRGQKAAARSRKGTPVVARVTAMEDAIWAGDGQYREGDPVGNGPLRLASGVAQLTFASGARVALNGAVDVEIVNAERIFLRSGRIAPFVPPEATGFTVVSPSGEVVDLGTEFSVGVDASGLTDVYVIDGKVDVGGGHARTQPPVRMTQGYGARLVSPAAATPDLTQRPLVIDHFDEPDAAALRWINLTPTLPAVVHGGSLVIPIQEHGDGVDPAVRILLDHNFTPLVGAQSVISFKATLPNVGTAGAGRWVALVVDGHAVPDDPPGLPLAARPEAAAAVMVSPRWHSNVRIMGRPLPRGRFFARPDEAVGPYQVVVRIDDTPENRRSAGGATVDVMVNGVEIATAERIDLGASPRLGFQTFFRDGEGQGGPGDTGAGLALIDDFSVSVERPGAGT
jgi:hypothetical protein